jgi:hypothetical protein
LAAELTIFSYQILQHRDVQRLIRHNPLQFRVLFFQLPQAPGFAHLQPAILAAPGIKRSRADAVLAAQLTRLGACFALLQYLDHLFFVKSAVLHSLSSFRNFHCFGKPSFEWRSSVGQGHISLIRSPFRVL